eukprot:Amastigsp_a679408_269.p2 type:complete len:128 gc:universal Amastigsp_a679408_269:464-847(+)
MRAVLRGRRGADAPRSQHGHRGASGLDTDLLWPRVHRFKPHICRPCRACERGHQSQEAVGRGAVGRRATYRAVDSRRGEDLQPIHARADRGALRPGRVPRPGRCHGLSAHGQEQLLKRLHATTVCAK